MLRYHFPSLYFYTQTQGALLSCLPCGTALQCLVRAVVRPGTDIYRRHQLQTPTPISQRPFPVPGGGPLHYPDVCYSSPSLCTLSNVPSGGSQSGEREPTNVGSVTSPLLSSRPPVSTRTTYNTHSARNEDRSQLSLASTATISIPHAPQPFPPLRVIPTAHHTYSLRASTGTPLPLPYLSVRTPINPKQPNRILCASTLARCF